MAPSIEQQFNIFIFEPFISTVIRHQMFRGSKKHRKKKQKIMEIWYANIRNGAIHRPFYIYLVILLLLLWWCSWHQSKNDGAHCTTIMDGDLCWNVSHKYIQNPTNWLQCMDSVSGYRAHFLFNFRIVMVAMAPMHFFFILFLSCSAFASRVSFLFLIFTVMLHFYVHDSRIPSR